VTRTLLTPVFIALAIAAVVAFVVVILVRGGGSSAAPAASATDGSPSASRTPSASAPSSAGRPAVRWSTVVPTLACSGVGTVVDRRIVGDLNGDGRPDAVISAHCDAGAGSPPSVVEVYLDVAGTPHALGDAVSIDDDLLVQRLSLHLGLITVQAQGYTRGTPRCCPDRTIKQTWRVRTAAGKPRLLRVH
jgi:hypothetical protein